MLSADHLRLTSNFGKVTCERTWKWDTLHQPLPDFDLWYVWSGEGHLSRNGEPQEVSKGSCYLFRPGDATLAGLNPQKPLTVTFIHFSIDGIDPAAMPAPYHYIKDTPYFEALLNRFVMTMVDQTSVSTLEASYALTLMLLHLLREETEETRTEKSMIHEVAHYIKETPGEEHTIAALAEKAQLSPRYFSLKFKETMGVSLERYVVQTRIERAEHLLRFNGMTVGEVAEALGYRSIYFFSRQFKQYRGKTPSEVRRM
ncbi:helix-turn-helix domain-containing protein [Paenibacillus thalictri]|uniref:AraC family transcriptional regulator n=1 Tax=Paenibacillus thalictri TaxID=2527873 RepID=A0A4Q9DW82_9BACL|nr:AraC family transcriptional regulator [Paenibacillus thalictri]TBL80585.1 AraC family transcriptional regulator [Paenibacillus thalictri]